MTEAELVQAINAIHIHNRQSTVYLLNSYDRDFLQNMNCVNKDAFDFVIYINDQPSQFSLDLLANPNHTVLIFASKSSVLPFYNHVKYITL